MLNSEKTRTGVLCLSSWTVRLFDVVVSWISSSSLWTSPRLKPELQRSIEVVLAGHHFVADLSTWFREVTDISAASFCLDDQSGGMLVLLKKKLNSGSLAHSLSSSLQCYRIMLLFFLEKKKDRARIFQQRGRQIYTRSGKNHLACILSHPSRSRSETVKDVLFIRRKESTCAKQESWFNKWRIDGAFSSGWTSCRHLGVVARHPSGGGTSLLEGIFPFNWPIRARLFYWPPGPRPKSRRHHINNGWAWFEAIIASNQALPALDSSHATCCYWRWLLESSRRQ